MSAVIYRFFHDQMRIGVFAKRATFRSAKSPKVPPDQNLFRKRKWKHSVRFMTESHTKTTKKKEPLFSFGFRENARKGRTTASRREKLTDSSNKLTF
jgi:hypothetical protein